MATDSRAAKTRLWLLLHFFLLVFLFITIETKLCRLTCNNNNREGFVLSSFIKLRRTFGRDRKRDRKREEKDPKRLLCKAVYYVKLHNLGGSDEKQRNKHNERGNKWWEREESGDRLTETLVTQTKRRGIRWGREGRWGRECGGERKEQNNNNDDNDITEDAGVCAGPKCVRIILASLW